MEHLKQLRTKYHYSYQDMANQLGISKTYYWQIENNKRRLSYDMALSISHIFAKTPDEVFYEDIGKSIPIYQKRR